MHLETSTGRCMLKCKSPGLPSRARSHSGYHFSHDEMAVNAGKTQRPFIDIHEELTTTIQLKLIEYVKSLFDHIGTGTRDTPLGVKESEMPSGAGSGYTSAGKKKPAAQSKYEDLESRDGWPVMPEVSESDLKEPLEDLLRRYLTAQYSESSCPKTRRSGIDTAHQNWPRDTGSTDYHSVPSTKIPVNLLTRSITRKTSNSKIHETSGRRR